MKKIEAGISVLIALCLTLSACSYGKHIFRTEENTGAQASSAAETSSVVSSSAGSAVSDAQDSAAVSESSEETDSGTSSSGGTSSSVQERETVSVTIPEGFTIDEIGIRLANNKVCSRAAFYKAVRSFNYKSYSVTKTIAHKSERCFALEGYLYPDTYEFYVHSNPKDVIAKMLRNTQEKVYGKYKRSGFTLDQLITVASIVQKEVPDTDGMKNAASVIYNRLKDTKDFPRIGMDCTVYYLTRYLANVDKLLGTDYVDKYKSYYNTERRRYGLPVGPICNPGAQALNAAAHPHSTHYYYFSSDTDGTYHFSGLKTTSSSSSSSSSTSSK